MLNIHFLNDTVAQVIASDHAITFRKVIGLVVSCPPELPKITFGGSVVESLSDQGLITKVYVAQKVIVQTYTGELDSIAKSGIAQAIYSFLKAYNFEKDLTIIFEEVPVGNAFTVKDGHLIPTPMLPTPQNNFKAFTQR